MIAAYVIGYPVTSAWLANNPHLKFAEGPDDTGVIISYNTQNPSVTPPYNPVVSNIVGIVIHPITWTRTESEAATAEGLGPIMPDSVTLKFRPVPQYADAKVDMKNGAFASGLLFCFFNLQDTMAIVLIRHDKFQWSYLFPLSVIPIRSLFNPPLETNRIEDVKLVSRFCQLQPGIDHICL